MSPLAPALPNAAQRLLLRAAVSKGSAARSAWEDWRHAGGDIDTLDASTSRLLPAAYRNLEAARVRDPDILRLRGVYRHTWAANQRVAERVGETLEAVHREGIPTMVLKGAAVCMAHYRDAGARRLDDVGVLVRPPDVERALVVLRAKGWSPNCRIDPNRILRSRHAMPLVEAGGAHFNLHWRALPESIRDDDFWGGAVPAVVGRTSTLAPGPTEQLLHTCGPGVKAGPDAVTWIADAAVIVQSARDEIDWARLVDGVAQRGIALTTTASLLVVREVLAAPIPDWVMTALGALPSTSRERLVARLTPSQSLIAGCVYLWDMYRRRAAAEGNGYVYRDFLQYVADAAELPSRRAIAARLVQRAISLGPAS